VGLNDTLGRVAYLGRVQTALLLAYAAVLPVSMTASWVVLIAGLFVLAIQLLSSAIAHSCNGKLQVLAGAPLLKPLLVFIAAVAVSGLVNGGLLEALSSVLTLKGILCYFWAYSVFVLDRKVVRSAILVLLSVGAIAGIFGAVEQIANFHPFGYRYLQGTGFLGGPMSFAGQMQMLSILSIVLLLLWTKISQRLRMVLYILAAGNCLGVIFAAERSSWLGFIAALAIISIAVSWRRFIVTMTGAWALAAMGWLLIPVFQKRLLPLLSWHNDVSVRVRLFLWQQSIALWQHNPLFGVGLRNFPHFDIPEAIVPGRSIDINHAHSNYLQILATTGIVGLIAYLWLWLCMLLTGWRNFSRIEQDSFERAIALGIFGGTIALFVSGIFEYNFGTAHVRLMQWFLLAMLLPAASILSPAKE
jgi:O-antigen ligase